jgi:hypothetical protein
MHFYSSKDQTYDNFSLRLGPDLNMISALGSYQYYEASIDVSSPNDASDGCRGLLLIC